MKASDLIARFSVTSSTPLLIGGYDSYSCRTIAGVKVCEGLRSQSVKGVWRWFTRSLIAGILWGRYRLQDDALEQATIELTARLLGAAGAGKGESLASRVKLQVYTMKDEQCDINTLNRLRREHQRVKLLFLAGIMTSNYLHKRISLCERVSARVVLRPRLGEELSRSEKDFAAASLVAAFMFGCFGKASRRGLGCFDILMKYYDDIIAGPWPREVVRVFRGERKPSINDVRAMVEVMARTAKDYVESNGSIVRKYLHKGRGGKASIPPIPVLLPGGPFKLYYIDLGEDATAPLNAAIVFSQAVTRSTRARLLGVSPLDDPIYVKRAAWLLGLPRSIGGKGYLSPGRIQRRASPILLSVHRGYALLSVFYSLDWPQIIRWRDHGSLDIRVRGEDVYVGRSRHDIKSLIDDVTSAIIDAMNKGGFRCARVI